MKQLWIITASLTKTTGAVTTHRSIAGWRIHESRDAAIGLFVTKILEENPTFSISDVNILTIPTEEIIAMLRENGQYV